MKKIIILILTGLILMLVPLSAQEMKASAVKEINITNKGLTFTPNEISVSKGDTVRITYTNAGGFHDLVIDEFMVRTKQIKAGESDSFEFRADKSGVFEFYCSVGNHRKMGMFGKLTVSE